MGNETATTGEGSRERGREACVQGQPHVRVRRRGWVMHTGLFLRADHGSKRETKAGACGQVGRRQKVEAGRQVEERWGIGADY